MDGASSSFFLTLQFTLDENKNVSSSYTTSLADQNIQICEVNGDGLLL